MSIYANWFVFRVINNWFIAWEAETVALILLEFPIRLNIDDDFVSLGIAQPAEGAVNLHTLQFLWLKLTNNLQVVVAVCI